MAGLAPVGQTGRDPGRDQDIRIDGRTHACAPDPVCVVQRGEAGISLGGGLRKLRFARPGSGKSGGYRTVYVFGGTHMPVFLVTIFAKNEKDNLSRAEQSELVALSKALIDHYGARQ